MADSLGLTLHYDAGKDAITGNEREVNVSGLKLSVPEVVSSLLTEYAYMLMVELSAIWRCSWRCTLRPARTWSTCTC